MKVEIKTNKNGFCEYFIIDGKKYEKDIYSIDIHIRPGGKTKLIIEAKSDEFILSSENTELYLEKKEKSKNE